MSTLVGAPSPQSKDPPCSCKPKFPHGIQIVSAAARMVGAKLLNNWEVNMFPSLWNSKGHLAHDEGLWKKKKKKTI